MLQTSAKMTSEKPNTDYSEPEYARSQQKEKPPFFREDISHKIVPEVSLTLRYRSFRELMSPQDP